MSDRVILFLDYQNVYRCARDCFHAPWAPYTDGQVHPARLGELLVANSPYQRELAQVRVYRGRPDSSRDPRGYAACSRQIDIWSQDPRVHVTTRTLRYPKGWPADCEPGEKPEEKGIDVALAIDFVRLALDGSYDVGILMSTDTDLKPALEVVAGMQSEGGPRAEVAAWSGHDRHNRRLSIAGRRL